MIPQQYPRETTEFVPVDVTNNGEPVLAGVQLAVVLMGARPSGWTPALLVGQLTGFQLTGLQPGYYDVYAQPADGPFSPVIFCGTIQVT